MKQNLLNTEVLRVEVKKNGAVDIYNYDTRLQQHFKSIAEVDEGVRCKVAALSIMKVPPTVEVDGVGQRIDERVFWIYQDWGA